ncbi:MAG: hydrogen peroxide-dependent heme synthase [Planctomycetales bacterium]
MNRPAHASAPTPPTTLLSNGWHCLHLYYRICQGTLQQLGEAQRAAGRDRLIQLLDPTREGAPLRLQTSLVSGHKADLGVLMMDPDPLKIDAVRQSIRSSPLGAALIPVYSFVSITEISEYVPTLEQYGERLQAEGADPATPVYAAKLKAYEEREVMMRKQRLFPDFPPWPVVCFYPMNKIRHPHANWYTLPFSRRFEMMLEHGKSGMMFAGKVSQVITASTGFDDWEWGVTLWAREPAFLKEIVYTMRFDEASANYAEFGPFYVSYIQSPADAVRHLQL